MRTWTAGELVTATHANNFWRDNFTVMVEDRNVHDFGGTLNTFTSSTAWAALSDSPILQIDASHFGSGRKAYLEVTAWSQTCASASANFRLYQTTAAAAVTGSTVAVTLLSTAFIKDRARSCEFTLTGSKLYEIQVEGTIGSTGRVAGRARVYQKEVV